MPTRLLLAIVMTLAVVLGSVAPAEVEAWADPIVEVGECEATTVAEPTPTADAPRELERDLLALRPRDASPPPVPPPER